MNEKIYFPIDENLNLFSVASSSTGLVVPLEAFGYPGVHLTFYIRAVLSKPGFKKLSVHITDDSTGEIIKEEFVEFNEEQTKQKYEEKAIKLVERLGIIYKNRIVIVNPQGKNLHCYDCIGAQSARYKVHTRSYATETYSKIFEELKNGSMLKLAPCSQPEHKTLIDSQTGELFLKHQNGLIKFGEFDTILEELNLLYEEIFSEEVQWIENLRSEFGKALEAYKV